MNAYGHPGHRQCSAKLCVRLSGGFAIGVASSVTFRRGSLRSLESIDGSEIAVIASSTSGSKLKKKNWRFDINIRLSFRKIESLVPRELRRKTTRGTDDDVTIECNYRRNLFARISILNREE